ncbi:MAG: polyprenyl synthetase family protein [Gemmatimonadaceae bacterium]|nr:polyprenyl synthetase family protein [Gemmatimonadaceae bacterium]
MAPSSSSIPTDPAGAIASTLASHRPRIDAAIEAVCDRHVANVAQPVADAIRYALGGGGKRLRGVLVLESHAAVGGTGDASLLAAAVEIVHAYSLVHDDLPCMDDDDLRRGQPTVHRRYGVPAATRAGLAMVPLAALAGQDAARALALGDQGTRAVVRELMHASGASGMIGGQLLDLDGERQSLSVPDLERIHAGKTGALLAASTRLGGIGAGAGDEQVDALGRYGEALGLAFQIADDVLDVTATSEQLGKTAGRDEVLQKSTYPALLGIDGAVERADALSAAACKALSDAGILTPALERLAIFAVRRRS